MVRRTEQEMKPRDSGVWQAVMLTELGSQGRDGTAPSTAKLGRRTGDLLKV